MKRTLKILLILISALSYSQKNPESDVFKKIIDHQIGKRTRGIYVQCEKSKTSFEQLIFKEETGLEVPENILKEIEANAVKSSNGIWNSELINQLNYGPDFIENHKFMTKKDAEELFEKTKKRQNIIAVSQPVFDNNYENCVVSVIYWKFTDSATGSKYFLKKVYGIWTIIGIYEIWMT
ncbi:hypothetical protein [Flavobacterium salmonis]|uniref:Uncharacterized protein n=1 Tax=Flavobacterium salmonis TaxID=2654844 RepID=A0A6V6Z2W9_9FLAO|nr:hypothetical protein [Flavobacterium salmonis]CAD0005774.1 hypothetical protein FLAT13_02943 [Flavobacterium salmonis]